MSGDEPFVYAGKERTLFVVALRMFSDSCEAPKLTPTCPFYEMAGCGPSCGEQCRDLLAFYPEEGVSVSAIDCGNGIVAIPRRRRPRRGPEITARPFDAAAVRIHDRDRPTDSRQTVSLFAEILELSRTAPFLARDSDEREYLLGASIRELERRGFSKQDIVAGMADLTAKAMGATLAALMVVRHGGRTIEVDELPTLPPEWKAVCECLMPDASAASPMAIMSRFVSTELVEGLAQWNCHSSIDDLIRWVPPDLNHLARPLDEESLVDMRRGVWLLDRFARTYLENWNTSSLDLEWRYIHSSTRGCGNSREMATRRIDVNVLACALAERAVADRGEKGCRSRLIDPADFTTVAVDYLSSGNYNAAVSLYEGICQLRKSDAVVLNNLGFCLMPVNLSRAIEVLEQSIEMARKPQAITFANLALAHALSGDFIVARELAERCRLLPPAVDVWLWDIRGDGTFKLRCGVQSGEYAQELIWWIEREHLISRSDFE